MTLNCRVECISPHHLRCPNLEWMENVMMGNSNVIPITQNGNSYLRKNVFKLSTVLYAPAIKRKLLSVYEFCQDNITSTEFCPSILLWRISLQGLPTFLWRISLQGLPLSAARINWTLWMAATISPNHQYCCYQPFLNLPYNYDIKRFVTPILKCYFAC